MNERLNLSGLRLDKKSKVNEMSSPEKDSQKIEGVTFVQFSDKILTPDSTMRDYYRMAYAQMDGYYFPEHYMEIPFWIPTIAGMLQNRRYRKSLHIVEDMDASITGLGEQDDSECLLFSVMTANEEKVKKIVGNTSKQVVMGGYTDPAEFRQYKNAVYLNKTEDLTGAFEVESEVLPDYSLFEGEKCIPRLILSTGCLFKCTFCTVPTTLTVSNESLLREQVEALKPLDFKLIFIDDKSFSQAENWRLIDDIYQQTKAYNPNFQGFIIQTPPLLANKNGFLEEAKALGVKYIELGVETVNDSYLEMFNKPFTIKQLNQLVEKVRDLNLKIIPNLIMGIPGDDYLDTIKWIERNIDVIPVVNVNFLAIHYGNQRGQLPFSPVSIGDKDQNTPEKSWLTPEDMIRMKEAVNIIYQLILGI